MAQHSHVPKFGGWDNDNIPYTAYFENARKDRVVRMNPNDPEENPEAFMIYGRGGETELDEAAAEDFSIAQTTPIHPSTQKKTSSSLEIFHRRTPSDHRGSRRSFASGYASDKSLKKAGQGQGHPRDKPSKGWDTDQGSYYGHSASVVSLSSRHSRQRSGSQPSDENHQRTISVPKFGAWDETDPKSGEGFTILFNRVKEEKHGASARFRPAAPPQVRNFPDGPKNQVRSSSAGSKFLCCFSGGNA